MTGTLNRVIRPADADEASCLVDQQSVIREIGYHPDRPLIRIADGPSMYFTYRFSPGRSRMAWLLMHLGTQFRLSASTDGKRFTALSTYREHERYGSRVFVDLTPCLDSHGEVWVKFQDDHPEDGWGALLSQLELHVAGAGSVSRLDLSTRWLVDHRHANHPQYRTYGTARFEKVFTAPACWAGHTVRLAIPMVHGEIRQASLNGRRLTLQQAPLGGVEADITRAIRLSKTNRLEVSVRGQDGLAAMGTPIRVGLAVPACAAPATVTLAKQQTPLMRRFAPYTPERMHTIAGNYMQCLFDPRWNLLSFDDTEDPSVHFVHDSSRGLVALADESRLTPVTRLELARRLYRGVVSARLPGDEWLFAFKHDRRPIDIRPMPDQPAVTLTHKLDEVLPVASIRPAWPGTDGEWITASSMKAGEATTADGAVQRQYIWTANGQHTEAQARHWPGDDGRLSALTFRFSGTGPVRILIDELLRDGHWFRPGSWGPEFLVQPDRTELGVGGAEPVAVAAGRYLLIRGDNGSDPPAPLEMTMSRAVGITWDIPPSRIIGIPDRSLGSERRFWTGVALEYQAPIVVTVRVAPFIGYPRPLQTVHELMRQAASSGRFRTNGLDPTWTTNSCGIGPDGLAAAAWLFRQHAAREADEAEQMAVAAMRATWQRDQDGQRTHEVYNLINGLCWLHRLGHTEFDPYLRELADRAADAQLPDGSWTWCDFQLRLMVSLLRAWEVLGEPRWMDAVQRGLTTLSYHDNTLFWKGKPEYYGDFSGALTLAIFGFLGDRKRAQQALDARQAYIDDRGFSACSDLSPYVLGIGARGLRLKQAPRLNLGLNEFAWYDKTRVQKRLSPTSYWVNPYHPAKRPPAGR